MVKKLEAELKAVDKFKYGQAVMHIFLKQQVEEEALRIMEGLNRDYPGFECVGPTLLEYGSGINLSREQMTAFVSGGMIAVAALKEMIDVELLTSIPTRD